MSGIGIGVDSEKSPPESDIVITISFHPSEGSPARVFERAAGVIRALEDLDSVFVQSISSQIQTTFILEDLQHSSIKVFLNNILKSLDDDALKDLDWKKQVGTYLVKAKYAAIKWLDEEAGEEERKEISDLTTKIAELAKETDVRRLPDYPEPNRTRLAQSLDHFQEEKAKFKPTDSLTITLDRSEYSVHLERVWSPSEHLDVQDSVRELVNETDMFLIIRKPDFLGQTRWQFKHGKASLSMPIDDIEWLENFHGGRHPLKPGDALRVRVESKYIYDENGDLKDSSMRIVKVFEVKPAQGQTRDFWE